MRNAKGLATLGFVAALFALILTPMFFGAGSVQAQGAIPADLYGGGLAEGDVVVASIGDSECGTSTAERQRRLVRPGLPGRLRRRRGVRSDDHVHDQRRPRR